ncbi:MAG: glycosyltransferase family 39 protein [Candidatus Gottesmanbacteria bacterium]|nr:glycosyltransferase family 39 protein [Candidatus Gottesmanbacteria bacterium]
MRRQGIILEYLLYALSTAPFVYLTVRLFLWGPPVWPDEAIFTDVALTLNRTGHIATDIFQGAVPGVQSHFYFYPPFYFFLLAQWIKLFGASIESVRALSVALGTGALMVIGLLIRRIYRSDLLAAMGIFLLGIDPSFGITSRTARMDILVFFLIMSMVWIMVVACEKKSLVWFIWAGVVAAFAVMTHPLGLIVPAVGVLFLMVPHTSWRSTLRRMTAVVLPSLVAVAFWILSIGKNIPSFIGQVRLQFLAKLMQKSDLVLSFREDTLWRLFFGIAAVTLLVQLYRVLRTRQRTDIVWLGGFVFSILALAEERLFFSALYFEPFFILTLMALLAKLPEYHRVWRIFIIALFGGFFIVTVLLTQESWSAFLDFSNPYHEVSARVASLIPDGSHVLIVAIPDPYFELRKNSSLTIYEAPSEPMSDQAYRQLLDGTDVIVMTRAPNIFFRSYTALNKERVTMVDAGTLKPMFVLTLVGRGKRR